MSRTEIVDVFDEAGNILNMMPRNEAELNYHITANALIFVFDIQGRVWSQLRPSNKTHFPGLWDITACGGLLSGETGLQAANRELEEETGLKVPLVHVESFLNIFPGDNGQSHRRLSHLFFGITNEVPVTGIEVDEFRLWEVRDLLDELQTNPNDFVPPFRAELERTMKGYGAISRSRQTK